MMIGPPSIELESLSDALSRSAMFSRGKGDDGKSDDDGVSDGSAGYRRLLIARKHGHGRCRRRFFVHDYVP